VTDRLREIEEAAWRNECLELRVRVRELEDALAFYADPAIYYAASYGSGGSAFPLIDSDRGRRAIAVLSSGVGGKEES
jgi:hypothetical protein